MMGKKGFSWETIASIVAKHDIIGIVSYCCSSVCSCLRVGVGFAFFDGGCLYLVLSFSPTLTAFFQRHSFLYLDNGAE